jgi:hypothetical protein
MIAKWLSSLCSLWFYYDMLHCGYQQHHFPIRDEFVFVPAPLSSHLVVGFAASGMECAVIVLHVLPSVTNMDAIPQP